MSASATSLTYTPPRNVWQGLGSGVPRAILLTAVDLFAAQGYHATSTRDISTGAGLSPAAMYAHFRSKEEILFEITRRAHEVVLDMAADAAKDDREAVLALSTFIYTYVRWHAEHYKVARIGQYERGGLAPEHSAVINHMRRRMEDIIRDLIQRGVAEGTFDIADVPGASLAIFSLGIDVGRWFQPTGSYTSHSLARLYLNLSLRMLGSRVQPEVEPGKA